MPFPKGMGRSSAKESHLNILPVRFVSFRQLFVFLAMLVHLSDYILFLASKHNIDPKLRTPLRDHIKFPDDPITKKSSNVNGLRRVKIRRLDDCLPVPSSSSKRPLGTSTCSSSINSIAKRKKEHLPGGTKHPSMQKSVMSVIPISTFPEVDINTATR